MAISAEQIGVHGNEIIGVDRNMQTNNTHIYKHSRAHEESVAERLVGRRGAVVKKPESSEWWWRAKVNASLGVICDAQLSPPKLVRVCRSMSGFSCE